MRERAGASAMSLPRTTTLPLSRKVPQIIVSARHARRLLRGNPAPPAVFPDRSGGQRRPSCSRQTRAPSSRQDGPPPGARIVVPARLENGLSDPSFAPNGHRPAAPHALHSRSGPLRPAAAERQKAPVAPRPTTAPAAKHIAPGPYPVPLDRAFGAQVNPAIRALRPGDPNAATAAPPTAPIPGCSPARHHARRSKVS